jgi:hypothetical protein
VDAGSNAQLFVDGITPAKWCVFVVIFAVIQDLVGAQTIFGNLWIELNSCYGRCAECKK